ncbi:N-acetyltransferase [Streptomyces sp. AV19]|uniref:GNAT family N-acetyltransferase n=1 Tax=Streptomyces sp. AV19 TaxID=2793068 RepID=UPI0018FEB929|nr:GNAT family N-acetyltransferase [Streptomyces sp. AV19]MBH1937744.1 N-acetyltransferase [Streptomyces sp. AV19]MDG4536413.1 GNAT family N-acetyltransferase [Streptomyces sp. AV19]
MDQITGASTATRIRAGEERDLEQLTDLYNHYVTSTPITFDIEPVRAADRRRWLADHPATGRHRLLVAEEAGTVLGYATSGPLRPKRAYETSVETSIYLAPGRGGRGLGSQLYRALFEALAGEDVHRAYAAITLPNDASLRLHERFGFRPAGVHREVGRKFGAYWDVAWLEKALPDASGRPSSG